MYTNSANGFGQVNLDILICKLLRCVVNVSRLV